uniref:ATP-dependent (S)-NAD(P)H-hydrate dehydratase n=1 Tax=Caenorhabditis japonica TaxID=281687 RepID=A0A8R1DQU7_CAEJA
MDHFLKILPKLTSQLKKGDCGKIAVIGGSLEYTGAPYFAASSVARLGADLIHVFCSTDAAPVIKGYSPDLIVHPGMTSSAILPKLARMDAIVIGPGLGRNAGVWPLIQDLFQFVKERHVPFVIDGDGLWFVSEHIEKFPRQMVTTVLTPNFVEFSRLCKAALGEEDVLGIRNHTQLQQLAAELSRKMDVTIYMKGEIDLVVTPNGEVSRCSTDSSLRRCGGQGDVTAGSLGLLLFWAKRNLGDDWTSAHHEAGIASSWLVRTAGRRAFEKHGRSMNTPLLLDEIPSLVRDVETREAKDIVHSDSSKY